LLDGSLVDHLLTAGLSLKKSAERKLSALIARIHVDVKELSSWQMMPSIVKHYAHFAALSSVQLVICLLMRLLPARWWPNGKKEVDISRLVVLKTSKLVD
jgi:hypothetical protein